MAHETSLTLRLQSPITIEISFKAGHGWVADSLQLSFKTGFVLQSTDQRVPTA